jgi:hypothetical protein
VALNPDLIGWYFPNFLTVLVKPQKCCVPKLAEWIVSVASAGTSQWLAVTYMTSALSCIEREWRHHQEPRSWWLNVGGDLNQVALTYKRGPSPMHHRLTWLKTLIWCKIWGFHCADYKECRLLRCDTVCELFTLVTAYVVPSSLIPSTLVMEAIRSSEAGVLTRATLRHIQEDGILLADLVFVWWVYGQAWGIS